MGGGSGREQGITGENRGERYAVKHLGEEWCRCGHGGYNGRRCKTARPGSYGAVTDAAVSTHDLHAAPQSAVNRRQ